MTGDLEGVSRGVLRGKRERNMVVDDSEEGSGGSPFSKVELECGLASTSRQGLASSYEFEPPHHLRIHHTTIANAYITFVIRIPLHRHHDRRK